MTEPAVVFRPGSPVGEIVLNRPRVLNAMNMAWVEDLARAAREAAASEEAHVVVVRGAGRAFCAGLDLTMTGDGGMPSDFYPRQEAGFTALMTEVLTTGPRPSPSTYSTGSDGSAEPEVVLRSTAW